MNYNSLLYLSLSLSTLASLSLSLCVSLSPLELDAHNSIHDVVDIWAERKISKSFFSESIFYKTYEYDVTAKASGS